jgi:hypothetical protein
MKGKKWAALKVGRKVASKVEMRVALKVGRKGW